MSSTTIPTASSALDGAARLPTAGPIVVGTPGDEGEAALETVRRLVAYDGRAVSVVSALELPTLDVSVAGVPYVPDVEEYAATRRERVARQLRAAGEVPNTWPVTVSGDDPAHAIADAARAASASLIVVGAGHHDVTARLFGEVAVRVARHAPCPVLAVAREPMRVPPHVAVAAIDFSPSSVIAARAARDLLAPGGTLHLVHVWRRHAVDTPAHAEQDAAYERALLERFARVERELLDHPRDIAIVPASLQGDPVERLTAFAWSHVADVMAAGRQGHTLLERLFVGRVTTGLLRAAPCALLVTPEPALGAADLVASNA